MSLVEQLDFRLRSPNIPQRAMQRVAASRPGSFLFSKTMHHVDRRLMRISNGRASLPGLAGGLPIITLTTIGAKSGLVRNTPLVGIPSGGDLAVIGSGWGMEPTPAWIHNLRANPAGVVQYRTRRVDVVAHEPALNEAAQIWESAQTIYPGYRVYPVRATHREIVVFVLESVRSD